MYVVTVKQKDFETKFMEVCPKLKPLSSLCAQEICPEKKLFKTVLLSVFVLKKLKSQGCYKCVFCQ